nr:hypothetical protein [Porphyromonas gulae]
MRHNEKNLTRVFQKKRLVFLRFFRS